MTMIPVSNTYKGGFFKNRHRLDWRAPVLGEAVKKAFNLKPYQSNPITIVDVGCANGEFVKWFNENGFVSYGFEGSEASVEFQQTDQISILDLREPLPVHSPFYDLAISLEVAEHIEPEYADIYLENLTRLSDTILITAAPPGQKGHGHVNCQEKEWWIASMQDLDFKRRLDLEEKFIQGFEGLEHRKEVNSYAKNCMIFQCRFLEE